MVQSYKKNKTSVHPFKGPDETSYL